MTPCDCEPFDLGDGETSDHDGDCPSNWDHLHTAEQITLLRRFLMIRAATLPTDPEIIARMAAGITARAIQLGLEQP